MIILLTQILYLLSILSNCKAVHRLYGGYKCEDQEYQKIVKIYSETRIVCTGTLLNKWWVLTSGRCILDQKTKITVGVEIDELIDLRFEIKTSFVHPQYEFLAHDIGLLSLKDPIDKPGLVKYAKIPDKNFTDFIEKQCTKALVKGWGETEGQFISNYLLCANVPVINGVSCQDIYKNSSIQKITNPYGVICTGSIEGKTICYGDTGGPLTCNDIQIGISSRGLRCGKGSLPSVYTRVDAHLNFIRSTVRNKSTTLSQFSNLFILLLAIRIFI